MATGTHNILTIKLAIDAKVKTLINNDLKEVCRAEGLQVSGVKAALQKRILEVLQDYASRNDLRAIERLRYRVDHQGRSPPAESAASASLPPDRGTPVSPAPNGAMGNPYTRPSSLSHYHQQSRQTLPPTSRVSFRSSPFYQIRESLTSLHDLTGKEMPHNRHTLHMHLALSEAVCSALKADSSLRLMLYCALAPSLGPYATNIDITFPAQIEVRINGDEVKSNFKGLKNKPGTTKPADITDFVRKAPSYSNSIHVTYALTKEKFSILVNLVKKTSADELATRLRQAGNRIPKDVVLRDMARKAEDPDIVAVSTIMSLKDPISTMRISLPCRSNVCTHTQCFDGSYFLQLQEQAPTWTCPVCTKTITYASLCVDNYVQDILDNTSRSTDQIVIEPNGQWKPVIQGEDNSNNNTKSQPRAAYDNDSDEDVIEIEDSPGAERVKREGDSAVPILGQRTPPTSSREASTAASRPNGKRPSAVIDLTLSDDDEPPRPAKRSNTSQSTSYNTPASLQDSRFADLGNRPPSSIIGEGFQVNRGDNTLPPIQVPDILPPIQYPQPNSGLRNGQRLPWPPGASVWANNYRDSRSFSNSPS